MPKPLREVTCLTCRSTFIGRATKYCSRTCMGMAFRTRQPTTCPTCATVFIPGPGQKTFCSRACVRRGPGRKVIDGGYVNVRTEHGWDREHRVVMAAALGRPLERHETVHHINGDRHDNRLANLQLRQGQHGQGVVRTCLDCGSSNIREKQIA